MACGESPFTVVASLIVRSFVLCGPGGCSCCERALRPQLLNVCIAAMALLVLSGPYGHGCSVCVWPRGLVACERALWPRLLNVYSHDSFVVVSGPFGYGCSMCIAMTALLYVSGPFGHGCSMCIATTALLYVSGPFGHGC